MRFISFDLETTGILPGRDRIVEIGAIRFVNGEIDAVYSTLVDPQQAIPEAAQKVNGISNEMVKGKPTIEKLLPSFAEFCAGDVLVAHNAPFDFQFLAEDIKKYQTQAPKGLVLDTYSMAKKVLPGMANYKLGTLVQHLQISANEFHRAEADANSCGQVFIKLCQRILNSANLLPPIENLIALSGKGEIRFPQIKRVPKQLDLFDSLF
ncbi:MAG: 3'-5' exonuclease [Bdellovibrionales bacterium]|nr:3'-5' exonuclease [Bdellovibrionales bacterium]